MASDKKTGAGLLSRLLLGVFVPILLAFLIIGCILFVSVDVGKFQFTSIKDLGVSSLSDLGAASLKESTAALNKLGEKIIQAKAEDVAKQLEIYVKAHPPKNAAALTGDATLKEIAVQKVGDTGYTAVHDTKGINYFHANPAIVGTDLHDLKTKLPDFVKILDAGLQGPASGYYNWKDADGRVRPKYMFTAPVKGTTLIVAATTYIDEFSAPGRAIVTKMNQMRQSYSLEYNKKFIVFFLIVVIDLIILLIAIYIYSSSIVRPIRHLSEIADKISMGDLQASINVKGKGEVVVLAESIERMQTSVKAAIERLQKRRDGAAQRKTEDA